MRDGDGQPSALAATPFDTRFAVPVGTHVVARPRLHTQLTAGLACSCVLIAAPAGWGKTLLVSSWLQAGGAQGAAVWISLGRADDDVRAFWTSIADGSYPRSVTAPPRSCATPSLPTTWSSRPGSSRQR